jgi:Protein of unknown function (DUF2815)
MAEQKNKGNVIGDNSDQFLLPMGRITFNNLFKPQSFENKPETEKYSVGLIFDPTETFDVYKAALERLKKLDEFILSGVVIPGSPEAKAKLDSGVPPEDLVYAKRPITKKTDIEMLEKYPHMKDQWSLKASRPKAWGKPQVLGPSKNLIMDENKDLIYPGCYGIALVSLGLFNQTTLFFRLHAFQKAKEGEMLKGSSSARMDLFNAFTEDLHVPGFAYLDSI